MSHSLSWLSSVLFLIGCTTSADQVIRPGIEVLLEDSLHLVAGRRVGLLTNQTGIDRAGTGDVELLLGADVQLTAIFSPEHGFRGRLDQPNVPHDLDSATGLPIYSLYGAERAPSGAMLADLDVLLVDLQDIGARPYTYISTALLSMQAAAQSDLAVYVLDRPNPIGGLLVQGPVLDTSMASFVGMLPVPLRHGMTLGELAAFGNDVLDIGARLVVIPAAGWRRAMWFDETGLPWVRPSPNMPSLESATHYPGVVLFEGTNLSVGRGTADAFQRIGAPWLDPGRVIRELGPTPGVRLEPDSMTPQNPGDRKYADTTVPAIRLITTDRETYDPTWTAIRLLEVIATIHDDALDIPNARYLDARTGTPRIRLAIEAGTPPTTLLWGGIDSALAAFRPLRHRYLLYD